MSLWPKEFTVRKLMKLAKTCSSIFYYDALQRSHMGHPLSRLQALGSNSPRRPTIPFLRGSTIGIGLVWGVITSNKNDLSIEGPPQVVV